MYICSPTTQSAGGIRWHFIVLYLHHLAANCSALLLACSHCRSAFQLLFSGKVALDAGRPHAQFPLHGRTCTRRCLLAGTCGWDHYGLEITVTYFTTSSDVCEAEMAFVHWPGGGVSTPTLADRWFQRGANRSYHTLKIEFTVWRVGLHSSHAELCDN